MGEVFAGRYELADPIGRGGVGAVWRAWDHRRRRYVAAKVLQQSDAHALLRFVREQALRIDHPHVLAPASWAADDDKVLFTMDLVAGGSLVHLVNDYGPLPPPFVCTLLDQLLAGVAAVHAEGVVHRDIKPANVLLEATGTARPRLRLSDFGIAMRLGEPRLTETNYVVGTPGYFAPEQMMGAEPDFPADLFAVGLVALYLLEGAKPDAKALIEYFAAHGTPAAPQGIPEPLWQVVATLVQPDPHARFRTATGARKALASAAELLPEPGPDDELVEVFDQLGPLPPGFGPEGPLRTAPGVSAAPGDLSGAGGTLGVGGGGTSGVRTGTSGAGTGHTSGGGVGNTSGVERGRTFGGGSGEGVSGGSDSGPGVGGQTRPHLGGAAQRLDAEHTPSWSGSGPGTGPASGPEPGLGIDTGPDSGPAPAPASALRPRPDSGTGPDNSGTEIGSSSGPRLHGSGPWRHGSEAPSQGSLSGGVWPESVSRGTRPERAPGDAQNELAPGGVPPHLAPDDLPPQPSTMSDTGSFHLPPPQTTTPQARSQPQSQPQPLSQPQQAWHETQQLSTPHRPQHGPEQTPTPPTSVALSAPTPVYAPPFDHTPAHVPSPFQPTTPTAPMPQHAYASTDSYTARSPQVPHQTGPIPGHRARRGRPRPGPPAKVAIPVLLLALACFAVGFWALAQL
ncbi:protein kinase [Streptomyces sp. NPDC048275]|uniref:serine/threonine-protein kinase n=1 Tax=Streptomyces sp. NPDC048275 TaxID=3155629 RepID=UPI0033CE1F18